MNLRFTLPARIAMFKAGLAKHGYRVDLGLPQHFGDQDILVTWNRIGGANAAARAFQAAGRPVLVTENASWGNDFAGDSWYTVAQGYHNTAGCFPIGDNERWDSLGIELPSFRAFGETVILPQRGIGSKPVAMPSGWEKGAIEKYGGRVRRHPGKFGGSPLHEDLKDCARVVTWGSGAAIKALMLGINVTSEMPNWIGEQDNTEAGRLEMFRRLAWAQWRWKEIESGKVFEWLL